MTQDSDLKCFRTKPSQAAVEWLVFVLSGAASIAASASALMSDSPDQVFDGCVGGVGFGLFALVGVLNLSMTWRQRITISAGSIEHQGLLRFRQVRTANLTRVEWRCPPRSGKIVLSEGAIRLAIGLYDYSPADRVMLVDQVREAIPAHVEQKGWDVDVFRRKPRIPSLAELKRLVRFTIVASFLGWLGSIAIAAWSIYLGEKMPPLWLMALKGIPLWGVLPLMMGVVGWISLLDYRERGTEPSSTAPAARAGGAATR